MRGCGAQTPPKTLTPLWVLVLHAYHPQKITHSRLKTMTVKKKFAIFIVTLVSALLVCGSPAHASSILINGSFEEPNIPTGTFQVFSSIPGWTTTFGSGIEIQDNVAGSPFDGDQFVELDSFNNSGMVQAIPTVIGQMYNLSFAYSPRPRVSAASNGIDVFFDGALVTSLTGSGGTQTNWTVFNFMVTATGTSSPLEFRATGISDSLGGYLDAASFSPRVVPEPFTLLLLGTGLAMAGVKRYRQRKS